MSSKVCCESGVRADIMLPADVARASLLTSPGKLQLDVPKLSKPNLDAFATDIKQLLGRGSSSVVLADFLVDRFRLRSEVQELIEAGSFSNATLSMGKGVLDEHGPGISEIHRSSKHPRGSVSNRIADAVIAVGVTFADVLTAGFSHQIDPRKLIDIQPFGATVAGRFYVDVPMRCLGSHNEACPWPKDRACCDGEVDACQPFWSR